MPTKLRLKNLKRLMVENSIDFLLITNPNSLFYLTDQHHFEGNILITKNENHLITDYRYQGRFENLQMGYTLHVTKEKKEVLKQLVKNLDLQLLHFEADHLTVTQKNRLQEILPRVVLKEAPTLLAQLREQKDPEEIQRIQCACSILDQAFNTIQNLIVPGITEKEIAWKMEILIREQGAESLAFPIIVASGSNSAIPHHYTSERKIKKNDVVLIDAGAVYKGYCSDCTRTYFLGTPHRKLKEAYMATLRAQQLAQDHVKEGISANALDTIARQILEQEGFGDYFTHSTGHGVGIEIHENPSINQRNTLPLRNNSIITIEPGVYLENLGGIRIEDTVLVQKNANICCTSTPKSMTVLKNK